MRHFTSRKNFITLTICLLFCLFVFSYEIHTRNKAETRIKQHALVLADAIWNVNIDGVAEYLRLAVAANDYSSFTVHDEHEIIFQTFNAKKPSLLDRLFRFIQLTPEIQLTSQVVHDGRPIGAIEAIWHPPTIYIDICVMFVLALATMTLHLHLRTLLHKTILEEQVRSRTKELAQSNRTLLREVHQKKKTSNTLRKSEEEYRKLYRESKRAEELYRSLIDSSADAILICGLNRKVEFFSQAFTSLFGWELDEVKGSHLQIFAPEYAETADEIFSDIQENGTAYQAYEMQAITKNGNRLHTSLSGSRFNDHKGQPAGILFVIHDISYRKKMEKQLQRAERMEAVGTLAGGIAHDFNNLLMGIQGNVSLALLEDRLSTPVSDRLQTIETYIQSGRDLTGQMLGFARGGKYEVKATDLNSLIQEESTLYSRTRKDITFLGHYQNDIWPVEADRGQIKQVLLNLYVNAGQAMSEGGTIRISTKNVVLDAIYCDIYEISPGRYVQISITDNGHGMDKQTQERIFDPFFTTKEIGRGTGLGLASAYGIIKNHSGFIDVYSEPGEGATFTIYLPASEKNIEEPRETLQTVERMNRHGTILLVDDEEMILAVGREMLKALGFTVVTAESGEEACRIYNQEPDRFIAVILDMIMPDMDGGAVFERLKTANPEVNVLLSSGYSLNDKATGIMAQGCAGFLQKPFDLNSLSTKLNEIL